MNSILYWRELLVIVVSGIYVSTFPYLITEHFFLYFLIMRSNPGKGPCIFLIAVLPSLCHRSERTHLFPVFTSTSPISVTSGEFSVWRMSFLESDIHFGALVICCAIELSKATNSEGNMFTTSEILLSYIQTDNSVSYVIWFPFQWPPPPPPDFSC